MALQKLIQATSHFSNSFLSDLQREYLNVYFDHIKNIELIASTEKLPFPSFAKLEKIGNIDSNSACSPFEAIKTTLSAHHHPSRYNLIFVVSSDGQENHIYWGVQSRNKRKFPPKDFIQHISNFLEGIWQGTNLKYCPDYSEKLPEVKTHIIEQLKNFKCATALTGIPSLKLGTNFYNSQNLKHFLTGMRGKKFMYMVIAEPISEEYVHNIIFNLRQMLTPIGLISSISINEAQSLGVTSEQQQSVNEGYSINYLDSITESFTVSNKLGISNKEAIKIPFTAEAEINLKYEQSNSHGKKETNTVSQTHTTQRGIVDKTGLNISQQQAFSRKLINAHAQTVEKRINQYIERFEEASILECWNVGIYFLAEQQITAEVGGSQLKSLLSGQKSIIEPLRVHNLEKIFTTGKNPASKILQRFEQPNLKLINSDTKEQMDHPLGRLFNGLTTPLNTEELALLVNISQL